MTQRSDKTPPPIIKEEDTPFVEKDTNQSDNLLSKDTHTKEDVDWKKLSIGSSTLGWCMALMFACVIISLFNSESELVSNAFEAFKLIVMTVLGYIFGSNTKS